MAATACGCIGVAALASGARNASVNIVRIDKIAGVTAAYGDLRVPRGFKINLFAEGLINPRRIVVAPGGNARNYDVFVSESQANRIRVLRQKNGSGRANETFIFSDQLKQPYGIAFDRAGSVYVGNTDSIVRFPYQPGTTSSSGPGLQITKLTRGGYNQHWTRNLLYADGSKRLFVTVGSSCNVCEEHDPQRAAISVLDRSGAHRHVFASGMRNPVGLAWRPGTQELWTVVNERDRLGDNIPPDYLTNVTQGSFHGWPYSYTAIDRTVQPDPSFGHLSPAKVAATVPARVPVQAHSAALGLAFYPLTLKAPGAFPAEYRGDAFLSYHGSWNRSVRTGYKVVRVHFKNGRPVSVSDFVNGFLRPDGSHWGRPVDVTVAPDGSLLFSDDGGGKIWRVSHIQGW